MRVKTHGPNLAVEVPEGDFYNQICKAMPKRRYFPSQKMWEFPAQISVMEFVRKNMPRLSWDDDAEEIYRQAVVKEKDRRLVSSGQADTSSDPYEIPFKYKPYDHQLKALRLGRDREVFAYLMDQGTGKTKVLLDDAAHNFRAGIIDALLVLAPNSVKTNWCNPYEGPDPDLFDEVRKHLAPDITAIRCVLFTNAQGAYKEAILKVKKNYANKKVLLVISVNYEALNSDTVMEFLHDFCHRRKVMICADESTRIGNRNSGRAKQAMAIRKFCKRARIMTGTPVIKSPLKAFSQFGFLDPDILRVPTYAEFAARYASIVKLDVTVKRQIDIETAYHNKEELADLIAGVSYRVLKEDCLDLPPKVYQKRYVDMTKEMLQAYKQMQRDSIVWLTARDKVDATTALTVLLRLQQITAGYLPVIDQETGLQSEIVKICKGAPPKIIEAADIVEEIEGKVIIWCKFKFEVREMARELEARDITFVTFYGETSDADRLAHRQAFQNDPTLKVFIGQVRTGGIGITLTAANTIVYLSNTFSTEDRVQSEDRAHRIGQSNVVTIIDLISPKTVDEKIIRTLRENKMVSDEIMRDGFKEWI